MPPPSPPLPFEVEPTSAWVSSCRNRMEVRKLAGLPTHPFCVKRGSGIQIVAYTGFSVSLSFSPSLSRARVCV